jgi:hypothetical protein
VRLSGMGGVEHHALPTCPGTRPADSEQVRLGVIHRPHAIPVLPRPTQGLGGGLSPALSAVRRHQCAPQTWFDVMNEALERRLRNADLFRRHHLIEPRTGPCHHRRARSRQPVPGRASAVPAEQPGYKAMAISPDGAYLYAALEGATAAEAGSTRRSVFVVIDREVSGPVAATGYGAGARAAEASSPPTYTSIAATSPPRKV